MACIHFQLVNKDLAIDSAKQAIKLNDKFLPAHDLLAAMYSFTDQYDQAIAELKIISRLSKGDGAAYRRAGGVYAKAKNYSDAIKFYDYAIKLDPKDATTYSLKGRSLA